MFSNTNNMLSNIVTKPRSVNTDVNIWQKVFVFFISIRPGEPFGDRQRWTDSFHRNQGSTMNRNSVELTEGPLQSLNCQCNICQMQNRSQILFWITWLCFRDVLAYTLYSPGLKKHTIIPFNMFLKMKICIIAFILSHNHITVALSVRNNCN